MFLRRKHDNILLTSSCKTNFGIFGERSFEIVKELSGIERAGEFGAHEEMPAFPVDEFAVADDVHFMFEENFRDGVDEAFSVLAVDEQNV